jgi:hypothetical protein
MSYRKRYKNITHHQPPEFEYHPDYDWMTSKINGHGACWRCRNNGSAKLTWIYGTSWLKLQWYNLILLWKHYKRKREDDNGN